MSRAAPILGVLALAALAIYGSRLDSPAALQSGDEALLAAQSRSVAATGRDLEGNLLPLYFHAGDTLWLQPIPVYFTALVFKCVPSRDAAARMSSVMVGALDVILMYLVVWKLLKKESVAAVSALLLLFTPAHYVYSRLATEALYPVPFVTAWLLCLITFLESRRRWLLFTGAMILGAGFYSHTSALLLMPAYLALTCLILFVDGDRSIRDYGAPLLGFGLPLLCLIPWFLAHPASYVDTVGRWAVHPAYVRYPIDGLVAFFKWDTLSNRASIFWELFGPQFLFFGPVFLLPMAGFVLIGLYRMAASQEPIPLLLVIAGGLCVPLVAATFGERFAIARELALLPFAVLAAAYGARDLFGARNALWRIAGGGLLLALLLEFSAFYRAQV